MATGINDRGEVVGDMGGVAFIWSTQTGVMSPLPTLGGNFARAADINNAGQVVGVADVPGVGFHAFLWSSSTGIIDLGTLGGFSAAYAINNRGAVVGSSEEIPVRACQICAFKWTASTGMVNLGALNFEYTSALDINDNGQVVGSAGGAGHLLPCARLRSSREGRLLTWATWHRETEKHSRSTVAARLWGAAEDARCSGHDAVERVCCALRPRDYRVSKSRDA